MAPTHDSSYTVEWQVVTCPPHGGLAAELPQEAHPTCRQVSESLARCAARSVKTLNDGIAKSWSAAEMHLVHVLGHPQGIGGDRQTRIQPCAGWKE